MNFLKTHVKEFKLLSHEILIVPKKFIVNSIKYDKEYLWPYLRNDLGVALGGLVDYAKRNVKQSGHLSQKGHNDNLPFEYRKTYIDQYGCVEIDDIEENSVDFLFITNLSSVEDIEIDKKIYKRLTDPIYEKALEAGTALKIEIVKFKSKKMQNAKDYYYPTVMILPPYLTTSGFSSKVAIETEFIEVLNNQIESLSISKKYINDIIDWNLHSRQYWLDILGKIKPKVVFCVGYHRQGPMISAAHALGIKSVDIQHGIQVGWNPTYNNWEEMPEEGYQSLPDYFAVWGRNEFENIRDVFTGQKHQPILFGYPWQKRQQDFYNKIPEDLQKLVNQSNNTLLITLQRQREFPKYLKKLIESSDNGILWIVRSHPKGKQFQKKDFLDVKNVYISKFINKCPLNQLFELIDFNISEGSATVQDAGYFNIPSIVTDRIGAENYKQEIKEGNVFTGFSRDDFFKIIDNKKNIKINFDHFEKNVDLKNVLQNILSSI